MWKNTPLEKEAPDVPGAAPAEDLCGHVNQGVWIRVHKDCWYLSLEYCQQCNDLVPEVAHTGTSSVCWCCCTLSVREGNDMKRECAFVPLCLRRRVFLAVNVTSNRRDHVEGKEDCLPSLHLVFLFFALQTFAYVPVEDVDASPSGKVQPVDCLESESLGEESHVWGYPAGLPYTKHSSRPLHNCLRCFRQRPLVQLLGKAGNMSMGTASGRRWIKVD
jgi:hypothetical protein